MTDVQTLTREKIKLDEPGLYDVIFLNDNITTMDFVVRVLKKIFNKWLCKKWPRLVSSYISIKFLNYFKTVSNIIF